MSLLVQPKTAEINLGLTHLDPLKSNNERHGQRAYSTAMGGYRRHSIHSDFNDLIGIKEDIEV